MIKALVEVSGGPSVVVANDFEVLGEDGGGVPSVFSRVARDPSEHVVEGPALNPRGERPKSARGPSSVEGGKDEESANLQGGGVFGFGLEQESGFGEGEVPGPCSCLLDAVEENHKELKDGITEKPEFGSGPSIKGGSRVFGSSAVSRKIFGGEVADGELFSLDNMVVIFGEEPFGEAGGVGGVASVDGGKRVDDELVHLSFV